MQWERAETTYLVEVGRTHECSVSMSAECLLRQASGCNTSKAREILVQDLDFGIACKQGRHWK